MSDSQLPETPADRPGPQVFKRHSPRALKNAPLVLVMPEFADTLPLNPDETSHTLPVVFHGEPLRVTIPSVWPFNEADFPGHETLVEFFLNNGSTPVFTDTIFSPYDPDTYFPHTWTLPPSLTTTGGVRRIHYRVSSALIAPINSFGSFINVDKTRPNNGNPEPKLLIDADVLSGGLTQDYVDLHNGVPVEVVRLADLRIGEVYGFFWGHLPNLTPAGQLTVTAAHVAGAPLLFTFDKDHVQSLGADPVYVSFRRIDRAGNVGVFSAVETVAVNLTPLPDLTRPNVPLADVDGVILLADAWAPTIISIPEIVGAQFGDSIRIFWNTASFPVITIGSGQLWPILRSVPWDIVTSGGFDARHPVRVRYMFTRGSSTKPSPDNFFEADLTVAGPDPAPTPINYALESVTVLGVGGNNIVTLDDAPGPVPVRVRLSADFVPGNLLSVFWGGDAAFADDHEVQVGEPGQDHIFYVKWNTILSAGSNPALPVYYWTDNGINQQRSPATPVRVSIVNIIGLKKPKVLNTNPQPGFISCDSDPAPAEAVLVGVDWDEDRFDFGDTLTLHWAGFPSLNGNGTAFPETVKTFDVLLSDGHQHTGVEFTITPFSPLITRPGLVSPKGASAVFYYVLRKTTGAQGKSEIGWTRIDLYRSGGTCIV